MKDQPIRILRPDGSVLVEFKPGEPEYESMKRRCPSTMPLEVFVKKHVTKVLTDAANKIN